MTTPILTAARIEFSREHPHLLPPLRQSNSPRTIASHKRNILQLSDILLNILLPHTIALHTLSYLQASTSPILDPLGPHYNSLLLGNVS
jgi:hypothetical protein